MHGFMVISNCMGLFKRRLTPPPLQLHAFKWWETKLARDLNYRTTLYFWLFLAFYRETAVIDLEKINAFLQTFKDGLKGEMGCNFALKTGRSPSKGGLTFYWLKIE